MGQSMQNQNLIEFIEERINYAESIRWDAYRTQNKDLEKNFYWMASAYKDVKSFLQNHGSK